MRDRMVLTALTALAVAVAGCGTVGAGRPVSLAAAAAATTATTSRVSIVVTTGAPGMWVTLTGSGAFDYARARGWLRIGGPGVALEERLVPPKVYVRFPGRPLGADGKPWLAAPVTGVGAGPAAPFMFPGPQASPVDLLSFLAGASSGVKKLGTATIQGTRVTHYRASVDIARAVSRARPAGQARLRSLLSLLRARSFPADVWVDSRGLVRRIRIKLADIATGSTGAASGGPGMGKAVLTETVTFADFGLPVRVTAPPAAAVSTMPDASSSNGGGFFSGQGSSGPPGPPRRSGTLPAAQAAAAQQAVQAFWAALGSGHPATAVPPTVVPGQRACLASFLAGPQFTVSALRIRSVRPTAPGRAAVIFTVRAYLALDRIKVPVLPQDPGRRQWLPVAETGGHWYVDLSGGTASLPAAGSGAACS